MRLIDADVLLKKAIPKNPEAQFRCVSVNDIINAPTIEAHPERTGHWIEFPNHNAYVCSECGRIIETADGKNNVYKHYPYCRCGARMEGE